MGTNEVEGRQPRRRKYLVCGLSDRALRGYVLPALTEFADVAEIVGIVDPDGDRVAEFNRRQGTHIPLFGPQEFEAALSQSAANVVLVTAPDHAHAEYIVRALTLGAHVVAEKPLVVSGAQVAEVLAAAKTGTGSLRSAFNLRFDPLHRKIFDLVRQGEIGRVTNVEFVYNVDTFHGASYFLRWNRLRQNSGGLSITKSCHHFDLMNWWLADTPSEVFAYGALNYYGPASPHRPADGAACPYGAKWHPAEERTPGSRFGVGERGLGLPASGLAEAYLYDDEIDIEDTYSAVLRFHGGATAVYSANFSAPWEGFSVGINGTLGRIEATTRFSRSAPHAAEAMRVVRLHRLFGDAEEHVVAGGIDHAVADRRMRQTIFGDACDEGGDDPAYADVYDGAVAVLTGEAVWQSCGQGRPISVPRLRPPVTDAGATAPAVGVR